MNDLGTICYMITRCVYYLTGTNLEIVNGFKNGVIRSCDFIQKIEGIVTFCVTPWDFALLDFLVKFIR